MCDDINPEQDFPGPVRHSPSHEPQHEQRLLQYLDGRTAAAESRRMREHLAQCAPCRALARQWTELDVQLAAHFRAAMTPGFSGQVWRAIESLSVEAAGAAASKGALPESAWPAAWAQLQRRYLWTFLPTALDQLGYAFAVVLAVCLSGRIMPGLLKTCPGELQGGWLGLLAYGLGVSAPIFLLGLAWLAKRPLARLLACL